MTELNLEFLTGDTVARVAKITDKTGIATETFLEQMIQHVLSQLEAGGKMTLDLETGKLDFGAPMVAAPSLTSSPYASAGDFVPAPPRKKNRSTMVREIPQDKENWRKIDVGAGT